MQNVIRAEMDALKTGRGGYGEQIQEAKKEFGELRAAKDALIQQRNQITARLKQVQEKKDVAIKTQRSARAGLKFSNEEEFDREIASLRHQQETRSMSLNEEKRLIKEIEVLQTQKQQVSKVAGDAGAVESHNDSIKEIRAQQAAKNAEIDGAQAKLSAQKEKLDELYRLNEEERKQDKFPVLAKERKEIKEKLDALFTSLKEKRKEFKEANDRYYNNIRLVRKKKELERQKEEAARKAEYEAKLAEYEQEMAKIHPYQDEMDLCDALVAFLEKTYAKELKDSADSSDANASTAPVELDGMKPLQRKEEDYMSFGGGKKSKKGGKKSKKEAKFSLPLAQMEAFATIGLVPPTAVGAVSESLTAIKEKKVWFNEQTAKAVATPVAAAAGEAQPTASPTKKESKKKGGNKKFNASDKDAFPTLGGGEAAVAQTPFAWGPGINPAPVSVSATFSTEPATAADFGGDIVVDTE